MKNVKNTAICAIYNRGTKNPVPLVTVSHEGGIRFTR